MRKLACLTLTLSFWIIPAFAQNAPATLKQYDQTDLDPSAVPAFRSYNRLPAQMNNQIGSKAAGAMAQGFGLNSVPTWSGAFASGAGVYNYTMVGGDPRQGGATKVKTVVIPITLQFQYYYDSHGNPLTLSPDSIVDLTLASPNFAHSAYDSGYTQFGDAVQRAEFWSIKGAGWHTLLDQPRVLKPVTLFIPYGFASIVHLSNGATVAEVDARLLDAEFDLVRELSNIQADELPILLTRDVVEYEYGNLSNCCVIGYHGAEPKAGSTSPNSIQTFAWASWMSDGVFTAFSDVTPLSHEISEWMNDPFVNNYTPAWNFPAGNNCQGNLETGDPIEVLANASYPVTLNGFTYHPQNEALFQWFARISPSDAIHGAYSFPDTSLLTGPSKPCGVH